MYHFQLVSADRWQDESARLAGLDYFSRPKRVKHFYDSDYRDVVKKLVADPESCKDFYQVLQQVGLPYQTYYHKIPEKVAQVLATALFTESAILLELPPPSWIYNNSTFNSAYVKKKFKKIPYYQPDDSWVTVDLVNHRPELIDIRDGANIHKQLFTIETSGEEIFLRHCDPFSATKVLPKVHLLIGGNQGDTDLTLRGEKQLNVKKQAQAWLDELSNLLRSGNSPFTVEQDERLASIINYGFSPQHFSPRYNYNSEAPFRPDEQIGELFYQMLLILNETKFITAVGRIGDLGHDESEGAITRDPTLLRQTIKSIRSIRHSEGFDKTDYSYKSDKLAKIANEYLNSPLVLDGSGGENDYESKLKEQISLDVKTDELNDIENLYFTTIKLLKQLRTPSLIRNIETRRAYKLKAKKLTYQHVELKPADTIELTLNKNYKYKITARDYGYQFIGRFDKNNRVKVKIPARWSHVKSWDLTATPVEHSFIDEFFPALKTQYQNMLSMQGFTIGESDAGIMHANIMGGPEKPLHNLASTMQIMGGAVNLYIAATIGATGVGTPLAATIGFVGIDNIQAGVRSLFSEDTTTTYGAKFLEWAVVPKGYGEIAYALIDVGTVGKASTLLKATHQTANIVKFETINSAKSGQIVKPTEITITVENISVNQRHVISFKSADELKVEKDSIAIKPTVTAKLEVNGIKFNDTNQTARILDKTYKNKNTLIYDRVILKEKNLMDRGKINNLPLPNSNMVNAHAEIGVIQQAHDAGLVKGADLKIIVEGKDVCSYCKGDIAAMAEAAGAKSVTITAFDPILGIRKHYQYKPGMKSIQEVNQ